MKNIFISLFAVTLTLLIAEYYFRANNYLIKVPISQNRDLPRMQTPDSLLGWVNKKGIYNYSIASNNEITVSIDSNGTRMTSRSPLNITDSADKIIFIGGSFTFGQSISDSETMAWKIQALLPNYQVMNWAVPAYGTYQSLKLLEQKIVNVKGHKKVIYGLIDHHTERNIASAHWLDMLSAFQHQEHLKIPYVSLENNQLIPHPARAYNRIPLSSTLALAKLIERSVFNYQPNVTNEYKQEVLLNLLQNLENTINKNNGELLILGFNLNHKNKLLLQQNKFHFIECNWDVNDETMTVKEDGHPSGKANDLFVSKVINSLK